MIHFVGVILKLLTLSFYVLFEVIKKKEIVETYLNKDISFYAAGLKIQVTCGMWPIVSATKDWLMSNRSGWAILCKTITINWPPSTHKCLQVLMLLAYVLRYYIGLSFKVIIHYIFIRLLTSLYTFRLFSFPAIIYIYITVFVYEVGASILKRLQ